MCLMEYSAHSRLPNVFLNWKTKELSCSQMLWVPTHNACHHWKSVSPQIHDLKYGSYKYMTQHPSPRDVLQSESWVKQLVVAATLHPFYTVMELEVCHRVTEFLLKGRHLCSLWGLIIHLKSGACFPLATVCTPAKQLSFSKSLWKMLRKCSANYSS